MTPLWILRSQMDHLTSLYWAESISLTDHLRSGDCDTFIVSTLDGFSPLGSSRDFLSADLAIPDDEIRWLANWNLSNNERISLIALQSRREASTLHGVILAPCEDSKCYRTLGRPRDHFGPYRDFYYNVTYEAIAYANRTWRSRRLSLSHLSASGQFDEDIATCNAEALAHYCDSALMTPIDSLAFAGCCIEKQHLLGIQRLNKERNTGSHRQILTEIERRDGYVLVHLDWRL